LKLKDSVVGHRPKGEKHCVRIHTEKRCEGVRVQQFLTGFSSRSAIARRMSLAT
jgi:hypothetical protein